jgi:negative regulator of flagellin synthesis FlgM
MQIYGPASLHGAQSVNAPHSVRNAPPAARPESPAQADSVEISAAAQRALEAHSPADIRWDRVDAIRQQIAEGTYETDEKLGIALDRLLDQIG